MNSNKKLTNGNEKESSTAKTLTNGNDKESNPKNEVLNVDKLLTPFQTQIIKECLQKGKGGLSLPMGSGKTLISIALALKSCRSDQKILIVCSKTLISSWEYEIKKFFGEGLKYEIMYKLYIKNATIWKIQPETKLVITTPHTLALLYRDYELRKSLVSYRRQFNRTISPSIAYYDPPKKPLLNHSSGFGLVFSMKWGCLVVDEIQQYNNISTKTTQGLACVCADHSWLLSGTPFEEPKSERILGYNVILDLKGTPRCLPDTEAYVRGAQLLNLRQEKISPFKGLYASMVERKTNEMFTPPKINKEIVTHTLSFGEHKIYLIMKEVLMEVAATAKKLKHIDRVRARKFSTYKLAMLCYLRQSLVCPFIPLASVAVDSLDYKKNSDLPKIMNQKIESAGLGGWLNNADSVYSSRIKNVVKSIKKYSQERIVLFFSFRTSLDVCKHFLPPNRPYFELTAAMSIKKRGEVIAQFEQTERSLLLLTYDLGCNGLNLQCSNTVFLVDFWWNASKTEQAIARVLRFGQKAKVVNIIFFTSNTALEGIIFEKQKAKLDMIAEMMVGKISTDIKKIKTDDIIRFIALEDSRKLLEDVYY